MSPEWTSAILRLLVEVSMRSVAVAAGISALLFAGRVRGGALRHMGWRFVLVAMLAMPILPSVTPGFMLPASLPQMGMVGNQLPIPQEEVFVPDAVQASAPAAVGPTSTSPVPRAAAAPVTSAPSLASPGWTSVALEIYVAGVLILAFRFWAGWRGQRRVLLSSVAIPDVGFVNCEVSRLESPLVATPVTIGILRSSIILPRDWRAWPADTLRAVLAHEKAHVRRRDALVAALARINVCLFWFNPLAWWLERALATTAERACDDAGVGEVGQSESYARILVDMADRVRLNGGRLRRVGVGVHGADLPARIDRILANRLESVSRARRLLVALSCAAIVIGVASCRQPTPVVGDLRPDPEVAALIAASRAQRERADAARKLTDPEAARFEAALVKNPEDLATREILLDYYDGLGAKDRSTDTRVASYRAHLLWLIAHHPESDLLFRHVISASTDPVGMAEARTLWLRLVEKPDASAAVLDNAAYQFLRASDAVLAEQLYRRVRALDTRGMDGQYVENRGRGRWTPWIGLGLLYSRTIVDAEAAKRAQGVPAATQRATGVVPANVTRLDPEKVLRTLDTSIDQSLLNFASGYLMNVSHQGGPGVLQIGVRLAERVLTLNPQSVTARGELAVRNYLPLNLKVTAFMRDTPKESQYEAVRKMSEADRLAYLPELAERDYVMAESGDYWHRNAPNASARAFWNRYSPDPAAQWQRSKRYAQELLEMLSRVKMDPNYGTAFYRANLTLGLHALREGDGRTAVKYLLDAATAPRTDELAYRTSPSSLEWKLVGYLLKYGDRGAVATFLERTAAFREIDRDQRLKDAAAIRKGVMPVSYQWTFASGDVVAGNK